MVTRYAIRDGSLFMTGYLEADEKMVLVTERKKILRGKCGVLKC